MPEISVVCSGVANLAGWKELMSVLQRDRTSGIIYRSDPNNMHCDVEFEGKHYTLESPNNFSGNIELSSRDGLQTTSLLETMRNVLRHSANPLVNRLHIPDH